MLVESVKPTEKLYTYNSPADLIVTGSVNKSVAAKADDWYQDDQGVNYDGYFGMVFDLDDGDYTITLTKINYRLYSEVSFGLYTGIAGTISITINGQTCSTFVSDGYYVVEIQGKNLEIHKMNEPANVLFTAPLTEAQYNGAEALTLKVTESGWNAIQLSHILGTQAFEYKDVGGYNVTFTNMVGEDISQSVFTGDKVMKPDNPVREGYIFGGWYDEAGVAFDFDAYIEKDMLLVAKWYVLTESAPTTETALSGVMANVTTNAAKEPSQLVMTGGADNTYTFTLPTIEYFLYSEVSMIAVLGGGNAAYTFSAYGTNFANTSTAWNWVKVIKVGAEGKTVKNTETGADLVLAEGYYLTIGNTDIGSEWYKYVKLSDAVVNGEEGLTFSITTSNGSWDWLRLRQDGGVETDNFVGVKAYAKEDATDCALTEASTVNEYLAYVRKVNGFTAYEKANYIEPTIVATLRAKYAGASVMVASGMMTSVTTNAAKEPSQLVMTGGADNTYTFTLPTIEYFLYSEVSMIAVLGGGNAAYTFSAYGTNFANTSTAWNWVKVIKVGAEGKTVKNTETGADLVLAEGYYLTIGNTDIGSEWYKYVKLSDAVVNGEEGLTFSITTSNGSWDWLRLRQDGGVETDNFVGVLA